MFIKQVNLSEDEVKQELAKRSESLFSESSVVKQKQVEALRLLL